MNQTEHDNIIVDADPHFNIDATTRSVTNAASKKTSLIQYDHNSERFSFDIDRYIEGHDILTCNRILIHYVNIESSMKARRIGLYEVTDIKVHPDDDQKAYFTWLISENATQYSGMLNFLIAFECVEGDEILYRWNSSICNTISIIAGINNSNAVVEEYADELLKWEKYLADHFDELSNSLKNTIVPDLVEQYCLEREFATTEEVAAIFASEV